MRRTEKRQTDSFFAEGDDGRQYEVVELTTYTEFKPLNSPMAQWQGGRVEYETVNGEPVNDEGDGTFTVVLTDVRLRRK